MEAVATRWPELAPARLLLPVRSLRLPKSRRKDRKSCCTRVLLLAAAHSKPAPEKSLCRAPLRRVQFHRPEHSAPRIRRASKLKIMRDVRLQKRPKQVPLAERHWYAARCLQSVRDAKRIAPGGPRRPVLRLRWRWMVLRCLPHEVRSSHDSLVRIAHPNRMDCSLRTDTNTAPAKPNSNCSECPIASLVQFHSSAIQRCSSARSSRVEIRLTPSRACALIPVISWARIEAAR